MQSPTHSMAACSGWNLGSLPSLVWKCGLSYPGSNISINLTFLKFPEFRQTDTIISEITPIFTVLSSIKSLAETSIDSLDNLNEYIGEVLAKIDLNHNTLADQTTAVTNSITPCKDSIVHTRTQLSSILLLLNEALLVIEPHFIFKPLSFPF